MVCHVPKDAPFPSGEMVFVEKDYACNYNINDDVNSAGQPGMFILNEGTMNIKANANSAWYGVIYAVNAQKSSGDVVTLDGNSNVRGAVYVDGLGVLNIGESKDNLTYDQFAAQEHYVYSTAGIIQNTWRELIAG